MQWRQFLRSRVWEEGGRQRQPGRQLTGGWTTRTAPLILETSSSGRLQQCAQHLQRLRPLQLLLLPVRLHVHRPVEEVLAQWMPPSPVRCR